MRRAVLGPLVLGTLAMVPLVGLAAQPPEGTWSTPLRLPFELGTAGTTTTLLADGRVLVAEASRLAEEAAGKAAIYDPIRGRWTDVSARRPFPAHVASVLLPDGRVMLAANDGRVWLYDPQRDDIRSGRSFTAPEVVLSFTLTLLPRSPTTVCGANCGKVLLAGGCDFTPAIGELYDPASDRWSAAIPMIGRDRCAHTATLLRSGRVLIAGGTNMDRERVVTTAELFDPLTGTFTPTGAPHYARFNQVATELADGRVLVVGEAPPSCPPGASCANPRSYPAGRDRSAEIYVPASGRWSDTGDTLQSVAGEAGRGHGYAMVTLADDRVLLLRGGCADCGRAAPSRGGDSSPEHAAEAYDPSQGAWSYVAPAALGAIPGAVLLDRTPCGDRCGSVLVVEAGESRVYTPSGPLRASSFVTESAPPSPAPEKAGNLLLRVLGVLAAALVVAAAAWGWRRVSRA